MQSIVNNIVNLLGKLSTKTLTVLVDVVMLLLKYLNLRQNIKSYEKQAEIIKEKENTITEVTKSGTLDDLINLSKKLMFIALLYTVLGCTTNIEVNVLSSLSWEGHYYNVTEFREKTENIDFNKYSVWVLSDKTLLQILNDIYERKRSKNEY